MVDLKKYLVVLIIGSLFLAGVCVFMFKTIGPKQLVWFGQVRELFAAKKAGVLLAKDKTGKEIVLECRQADILSSDNSKTMQEVWDTIRDAYMPVEIEFLKAHPEVVGSDPLFKAYEPLFKNGLNKVDWKLVEEKVQEVLKSCVIFDTSNLSAEIKKVLAESVHIFVFAKDKVTEEKLGFVEFYVTPENKQGDVKCTMFAVMPDVQNRGLGKLLMSSILKIVPQTKRIYLSTRVTNKIAQKAYISWGFVKDLNPAYEEGGFTYNKDHWMFFEYKTNQSGILQKVVDGLVEI